MTLLALALCVPMSLAEAVEAEPERPGLRIRWAHELLRAGELDAAKREARTVLVTWPRSVRARLVLAGVAQRRGEIEAARTYVEEALAMAPEALAGSAERAQARLQPEARVSTWTARGIAGALYDTRAVPGDPEVGSDIDGDPAWRALLGAGLDWKQARGRLRLSGGGQVDRSVHFLGTDAAGERDRLQLRMHGRTTYDIPDAGVLGAKLEGRGALAGRRGEAHHGGGSVGTWWGRGVSPFSPWVEARATYLRFAERAGHADPDAVVVEGGLGAASHWRRWRGTLRLGVLRVLNDDGFDEASADLGGDVVVGPVVLSARGGAAVRDALDAVRPRASVSARWRLRHGMALRADGRFRAADEWTRWMGGLTLEFTR